METAIKELKAQFAHISTESILGMISLNFVSVAVKKGELFTLKVMAM